MWKVSVDYDEINRYKSKERRLDLESDSQASDIYYSRR